MIRKTIAFTLAETLIVMGIIGVVSALTLPNLNSSTGEKEKIAKVKKIYQNLDDALGRAQAVYGPFDEWFVNDVTALMQTRRFGERMTEFMKVSKNCGTEANEGCFANNTATWLTGGSISTNYDASPLRYKIIFADGTSVLFENEELVSASVVPKFLIIIDIDGPNKGSYTFGNDLFQFVVENNMVIPYKPANFSEYLSNNNGVTKHGLYASGWVIDYDNMDYLKLDKDGKCPNGTTVTEQNPRCK